MSKIKYLVPVIVCAVILAACTPAAQPTATEQPQATQRAAATPRATAAATEAAATGETIVALAQANKDLSTLVSAVTAADLAETLSGRGPFTVFAPNNAAFAKVPKATLDNLLKPTAKADLTNILTFHVVSGEYMAKDLKNGQKLKAVQGEELMVTVSGTKVMVGGATVTTADVDASNGVVHVIDTVLMPKGGAAKASGSPAAMMKASGSPAATTAGTPAATTRATATPAAR